MLASGLVAPRAQAEDPGELTVDKTASVTDVEPGDTFEYSIVVTCTNIGSGGCTSAQLTDTLPEGISLNPGPEAISVTGADGTATGTADGFTVDFTDPLTDPAGGQGMADGSTATITVPVVVDEDIDPELDGTDLINTATADGSNTEPASDTATVVPSIPITLAASTDKSFDPDSGIANPGTATTLSLSGGNDSNVPVDEITLTDPTDPPGAFEYLGLTDAPDVTLPAGAEQVQVDVYVDGNWINGPPGPPPAILPDGVDPADVQGIRIHLISTDGADIAPDATGTVDVPLEQRDNIDDAGTGPLANEVSTTVTRDGDESDPTTADADYTVQSADIDLAASKSFDPDIIAAGSDSTVTIGATNTSDRTLDTLTITEPDPDGDNNIFTDGLTFSGWGDDIQWPAGATGASVTYTYADGSSETLDADAPNTLPEPDDSKTVTGFTVEFTGDITAGAEASIPFAVTADEDQDADEIDHPNTISADSTASGGYHGHATADDTLTTIVRRIAIDTDKTIVPSEIYSIPGQTALVELSGRITDFPDSTTTANDIVVQDPADPDDSDWYDAFAPTGVVETPIPANATLTVEYYNGTEWVPVPGMEDVPGPDTFTGDFPPEVVENAQGIRFDYHSDDGFPPGTEVNPNINFTLKDSAAGQDIDVEDCANSQALSAQSDVPDAQSDPVCRSIHIQPLTPGNGDIIDKDWDAPKAVGERTQEAAGLTIHWSTSGANNIDQMIISDVPDPSAAGLDQSVFDSFDLVRIDPITADMDPHLTYDHVTGVELYSLSQDQWIEAPNDPCPAACDGTFPGYDLSAESQADTIAFRLTFEESPTRIDRIPGNPEAPPVGSGVARSSGNDRDIHPVFRIRDELRSDPDDPVLAEDAYNVDGETGQVRNDAQASVIVDGDDIVDQDASDIIAITPVNVTAQITKDWSGGPLGVPEPGTADFPDEYPTGRVHLAGENTTPRKVDSLTIRELEAAEPFDVFNLQGFVDITEPGSIGATDVTVTLHLATGGTRELTRDQALSATEAELSDVAGFVVTYSGRITSEGIANITFDTRLRPTHRSDGTPVTATDDSPVNNLAAAQVSDLDDYPGVEPRTNTDADPAQIELEPRGVGLAVTKDISPASQTEPDDSPVTVTLTGQPSGPSRTNWMQLTDDDQTFFNAYDFTGFGDFAFTAPIDRVRVDAYTGGTFTAAGGDVVRTGGQWVNGTAGTALALPDGVTADQVQGLRFTFTKADGSIWENPSNPTQTVLLQVQRRDDLRSGGPVTTDLAGNDPMPGEDDPGVSSDDVHGENRAADTVNGEPLTAEDDATDSILYQHSQNSVEVNKTPTGAQPPAADIPYTLTFTNNGQTPITNPVITDHIPSDADGPLLVKDPDLADGDSGYTYALQGDAPDPPNGSALPTDAAGTADEVTVAEDPTLLTFTFPEGTVLEVGQTYTITTALQFRTGLPGNTDVTNTTGITGDRPWDECAQSLDDDSGECQASTTVYPTRAGALRGVKMVKANDDELGVLNTRDDPDGCQPNDDGFYVSGCVPVTKPGGTDTWRFEFTNTGNLPQDKVYAIDRLPTPGDTGAITSLERGSQWTPEPFRLSFAGATKGTVSQIRVSYDTDQDLCTEDLDSLQGCPDGEWTALTTVDDPQPGDGIDLPADATAVKIETDFVEDMLQPTGSVSFDAQTRAPAQSETAGQDTIAWNTVAVAAETNDDGNLALAPKSEGNKVGAALATGPLEVEKRIEGPAADHAPEQFQLTLHCTSSGEDVDLGDNATITVTPGQPTRVDDLPWGSECTLSEDDAAGASDFDATTVTVGRDDQTVPVVIATNTYDDASLSLTKGLGDTAVDQNGDPVAYGPFSFDVDCTFLGDPVYADGYGPGNPMVATFDASETVTFTELPAGSECTATETDNGGASGTAWSLNGDDYTDGDIAELTLDPDGGGGTVTNAVAFRNDFPTTQLLIKKNVTGPGAATYGAGPFTVHLHCENPADDAVVYDNDIELGGDQPLSATVDDLYDGASCEVTEPGTGGANSTTIDPDGPFTVTGDDPEDPVTVTVANDFQVAPVTVTKVISGSGEDLVPDGTEFTVQLTCTRQVDGETVPVPIPADGVKTLTTPDDLEAGYRGLPVGATCTLAELDDGDATDTTITPDGPFTIGDTDGVEITVDNEYQAGSVQILKQITGGGADQLADGTQFSVQLTCTTTVNGETVPVPLPEDGVQALTTPDDLEADYADIPVGSECTAAETDQAGATTTTIEPDGPFTVGTQDEPVTVTATNDYSVAPVRVIKKITGDGAAQVPDDTEFSIQLTCSTDFGGNEMPVDLPEAGVKTLTKANGLQAAYTDIPVGAQCQAEELSSGSATSTTIDPDGPFTVGVADPDKPLTVTVSNDYPVGSVQVIKKLTGDGAAQVATDTEFRIQLTCTTRYGGDPVPVPLPDDGVTTLTKADGLEALYNDIPLGAECQAAEIADGGATSASIEPAGTFTVDSADPETPITVTATNDFEVGPVQVIKEITGDGAADVPSDLTFTVQLSCTTEVNGQSVPVQLPDDGVQTLSKAHGLEADYSDIPIGATCRATETDNGGAADSTISPATMIVGADGDAAAFTVVNTFDAEQSPSATTGTPATPPESPGTPPNPPESTATAPPGSTLPNTGGPRLGALIIGAALLIAGALALAAARRRRRG
ncbi:DUF5979 domain-containing protein [Microlunatus soli]|nr:DUF5979 domain-containing protein [Microlunatus soli]